MALRESPYWQKPHLKLIIEYLLSKSHRVIKKEKPPLKPLLIKRVELDATLTLCSQLYNYYFFSKRRSNTRFIEEFIHEDNGRYIIPAINKLYPHRLQIIKEEAFEFADQQLYLLYIAQKHDFLLRLCPHRRKIIRAVVRFVRLYGIEEVMKKALVDRGWDYTQSGELLYAKWHPPSHRYWELFDKDLTANFERIATERNAWLDNEKATMKEKQWYKDYIKEYPHHVECLNERNNPTTPKGAAD